MWNRLQRSLVRDKFNNRPVGLVTNEYAYRHPNSPTIYQDDLWEVTSGSLFAESKKGYTGVPDHLSPNATSSNGNNSAVFRCRTKQADLGNVVVKFDLYNVALYDNTGIDPHVYDGVHVWLRYQSEFHLYAVTINRRDNQVVIKKKIPDGSSNDGTYFTLSKAAYQVPYQLWQHVRTTALNNPDGSVAIYLWIDANLLLSATDIGAVGGSPITQPGRAGVRGDNCEFYFDNFQCDPVLVEANAKLNII